jgi:peroxiredoxin
MLTRTIALAAFAATLSTVARADDPRARELFEIARDAVKEGAAIQAFGELPHPESRVHLMRDPAAIGGWMIRWEGSAEIKESGKEPRTINWFVVTDGRSINWIDWENRTRPSRSAARPRSEHVQLAKSSWLEEMTMVEPFKRQLEAAEDLVYEGQEMVDDVRCDVARVRFPNGIEDRWFFAVDDNLPRKKITTASGGGVEFSTTIELSEVVINPELDRDAVFTVPCPEDFNCEPDRLITSPERRRAAGHGMQGMESRTPIDPSAAGIAAGLPAPDFDLERLDGERVRLSEARGDGIAVVVFWGSWVIGSDLFLPQVESLRADYEPAGVRVLAPTIKSKREDLAQIVRARGLGFDVLLDADDAARAFNVRLFPMFFVIDEHGRIVHVSRKYAPDTTLAEIRHAIDELLATGAKMREAPAQPGMGGHGGE